MAERSRQFSTLALYGSTHTIVDAGCAALAVSLLRIYPLTAAQCFHMVILYNALAFGAQAILGLAVDTTGLRRGAAAAGTALVAAGIASARIDPAVAICLAGAGNALFHVGGGAISLRLVPGRSWPCGIFVAPGALGLFVGYIIGRLQRPFAADLILPFLAASFCCLLLQGKEPARRSDQARAPGISSSSIVMGLLLFTVVVRSYVGFTLGVPWKSDKLAVFLLVAAAVIGKAGGGLLCDRFGWRRLSVGALIAAVPCLICARLHPAPAVAAMALVQMTMPVTLAAIAAILPGRPAFAFGLACAALIAGAAPVLLWGAAATLGLCQCTALVIAAAGALFIGLRHLGAAARSGEDEEPHAESQPALSRSMPLFEGWNS